MGFKDVKRKADKKNHLPDVPIHPNPDPVMRDSRGNSVRIDSLPTTRVIIGPTTVKKLKTSTMVRYGKR